jgi:hypothetical protein
MTVIPKSVVFKDTNGDLDFSLPEDILESQSSYVVLINAK